MNFLLQGIPNDIYNSVDAYKDAKAMWNHVKRLMQGTDLSEQERNPRLMNEFDNFSVEARESLESVYERFSRIMNNMQRNKLLPGSIAVNTKFLNSLQPKLSKYVTMALKRAARNHDLLALVAIASPLYSQPSQSYYVTHPLSMHDYDDDYQGESKNVRYTGNCSRNAGRITGNQGNNVRNGFVQKNARNVELIQRNLRTNAIAGKTPTEKMLLATKDEAGIHLDEEENDFMLLSASGDD
ncbi:hypothetical protein Tco_0917796 [Tanacetum coccineum]